MAICKNCGKPLILSGGRCIYCGALEKRPQQNHIQRVNNDATSKAIDLGLPSGTKWATCNLGAKNPWETGGYYAWGEIREKNSYDVNTYRWGPWPPYWKYCNDEFCNVVDNKWKLEPDDDAAHVNWGGSWRTPSMENYKELMCHCHSEWAVINNTRGLRFVSKINGKSVFFPAAGLHNGSDLTNQDCGYYKTSSLYERNSDSSYVFLFVPKNNLRDWSDILISPNPRFLGQSIRPVMP